MSILKRHTKIEDYDIMDMMSDMNCAFRNVYLVQDSYSQLYVMTVYDVDSTPAEYKLETKDCSIIREFEWYDSLTSSNIPSVKDRGACIIDGKNIAWMCCRYFESITLASHIKNYGPFNLMDAIKLFADVCVAVDDIARATNGGGHNNINPTNILIGKDKEGEWSAILIGLTHMVEPCCGRTPFPTKDIDPLYRAPETFIGKFDQQSDVYSLGVLFAYMILGYYPWDISKVDNTNSRTLMNSILELRKSDIEMLADEPKVKAVVMKALARGLSKRYKMTREFLTELSESVGVKSVSSDSCSVLHRKAEQAKKNTSADNSSVANDTIGRPASGIVIEKAKGNGYVDVAGMESLKVLFRRNFIDIVKNIEMAERFQITPPNATLLYGAQGVGKTFIVQKTAEEAGLNYAIVKPSDLASIYIHGSQSMIADLFNRAEKMAPVLLCFDEFDAMVPTRTVDDKNNMGGEVNEFLTQLNNCAERGIYVMGTTNRPDRIDKAVLRKGRFDELIYVPMPDFDARRAIFELELQKRPHDDYVNLDHLASLTEHYTSSDISYIVKEAARTCFEKSIRNDHKVVNPIDEHLLVTVISQTSPSVSKDELKRYEQMRKKLSHMKGDDRPKIGFHR